MQTSSTKIDFLDNEINRINKEIITCNKKLSKLMERRYELEIEKQNIEMGDLMECIIENDLPAFEVMGLVLTAVKKKNQQKIKAMDVQ